MAEVFAARFSFCGPGQPNWLLETGEARLVTFYSHQLFVQNVREPAAALRPFAEQPLALRALFGLGIPAQVNAIPG